MPILSKEREVPIVSTEAEPREEKERLPESEGYIEWVERKAELKKPVTHGRQVLVAPADQPVKVVVLPVTAATFADPKNWHRGVTFALRWLLEFVRRQIRKYPGQTQFKT